MEEIALPDAPVTSRRDCRHHHHAQQYSHSDIEAEAGHHPEVVRRVVTMVAGAEYKRSQAPPGVKVTTRAFGRDRRLPIMNRFTAR